MKTDSFSYAAVGSMNVLNFLLFLLQSTAVQVHFVQVIHVNEKQTEAKTSEMYLSHASQAGDQRYF